MLGTLQTMLGDHLETDLAGQLATVGVEREVRLLGELTARLGQELRPQARGQVSHDDVQTAQHTLHEATSEVVIEVLRVTSKRSFGPAPGSEPMSDVDRIRMREEILAPLNFQQELVGEAYARHKMPLDVDPVTGEELDPDASDDDDEGTDPTGA